MTASPASRRRAVLVLALGLFGLLACATPAPDPVGSALEPLPTVGARVPDQADFLARDLAAHALLGDSEEKHRLLGQLDLVDSQRRAAGQPVTGLVPVATDLVNGTSDDPIAYRKITEDLLEREDLSDVLRKRLEASVEDDPLRLADRRILDNRIKDTADVFNALVAPLSKAAFTPIMAGVGLAQSMMHLILAERAEPELEFRERQALAHWKRFLDSHPDAPEAVDVARKTEDTQKRWNETRRDDYLRTARMALSAERYDVALVLATRAERYWPEDADALDIKEKAATGLASERQQRERTMEADPISLELDATPEARALALALLAPDGDVESAANQLLERRPKGPLADEARYALALAHHEARDGRPGREDRGWAVLDDVADGKAQGFNMSRHASALVDSPHHNPRAFFERARSRDRMSKLSWIMLGPMAGGPQRRDLPRVVEWLIDLPAMAQAVTSFPNRLVQFPWKNDIPFGRATAIHARRYLALRPQGGHADGMADWLQDWHGDRGNWLAAWEVATGQKSPEEKSGLLPDLRARAARQALEGAEKQTEGDVRLSMFRRVASSFHGTEAADRATELAREELRRATSQRIRISRGFLLENPHVAGPDGLALRPELLDGNTGNGELHPEGVVLAGGRVLEFNYVGASGRLRQPATIRRQRVSQERLARLVALLDETALNNYIRDPGDSLDPDADRDRFFERARLGVLDTPDGRPESRSTYSFVGVRERYGLVRGREPVLPFDIVFKGSLPNITSFSVYPRIREPRATPDAILYR